MTLSLLACYICRNGIDDDIRNEIWPRLVRVQIPNGYLNDDGMKQLEKERFNFVKGDNADDKDLEHKNMLVARMLARHFGVSEGALLSTLTMLLLEVLNSVSTTFSVMFDILEHQKL